MVATIVASAAGVVVLTLLAGSARYVATGDTDPGRFTTVSLALLRYAATTAGALTLGALVYTLTCTRTERGGRVGADGYAGVMLAGAASACWAVVSLLLVPVSAADAAGLSVVDSVRRGTVLQLIEPSAQPKAWLITAILATVVALGARVSLSWVSLSWVGVAAAGGVLPIAVVGNAAVGPDHDIGTSVVVLTTLALSVWTGLAVGVRRQVLRGGADVVTALRRFAIAGVLAAVVIAGPGLVIYLVLIPAHARFSTTFGRLALLAAVLVALSAAACGYLWRRARSSEDTVPAGVQRVLGAVVVLLLVTWGVLTLVAVAPAPSFLEHPFTITDVFLGYDLPGSPTLVRVLTIWRFDFVLGGGAVVAGALYLWGVLRLRRRGDAWLVGRVVAWESGCLLVVVVTSSGVAAYGGAMFSMHMVVHMVLNMGAPVLLVLGGPATLALRALPPAGHGVPGPREWIVRSVHSAPVRVLSNPGAAIGLFVISLFGLYFSPLFDQLVRYHWGHELMNAHFLLIGYLYYWAVIGIDPGPRRLPHLGRLGLLFAIMPFHAFFGIATMTSHSVIGDTYYRYLDWPWVSSLLSDQRLGGGIAWAASEVPLLLVVGALVSQWSRHDRRTELREDRRADADGDADLGAYNAMLAELARTRK